MTRSRHNLIEILTHDHHELEGMCGRLATARDLAERRRLLDDVAEELAWHTAVEAAHLYPAVRRHLPDGDRIAEKGMSGNAQVGHLLGELRRTAEADRSFEPLARRLIGELTEHIREEEDAVFPRLAARADPEDLRRLGELVESDVDVDVPAWPRAGTRRRPVTPQDPDANDQASMWPDLWAEHRDR